MVILVVIYGRPPWPPLLIGERIEFLLGEQPVAADLLPDPFCVGKLPDADLRESQVVGCFCGCEVFAFHAVNISNAILFYKT